MRIVISILGVSVLAGCQYTRKEIVDKYPDGQVMTEHIYSKSDNLSDYILNNYYSNGVLKHTAQVSGGMFIGEKKSYFENGRINRIELLSKPTSMDDQLYDCFIINYRADGSMESEYQYINNLINGTAIDYDSLGRMVRKTDYVDGKVHGLSTIYHPNGKIKLLAHCRNDSAYGFEYEFSESGDTLRADISYGLSENGLFSKKWLPDGRILTGSYGDSKRSFLIWKWVNKEGNLIKSLVDNGANIDSVTKRYIAPE